MEERSNDEAADLLSYTSQFNRVIETYVRRFPDQWLWVHRRWKIEQAALESAPGLVATSRDLEADA